MLKKFFGKKDQGEPGKAPAVGSDASAPEPTSDESKASTASVPPSPEQGKKGRFRAWSLLKQGLQKTRKGLQSVFSFRRELNDEFVEELEASLYAADFGPETVQLLIDGDDGIREAWHQKKVRETDDVREYLKARLKSLLLKRDNQLTRPESGVGVVLVVGVNGTGKTTTIAKLAKRFTEEGNSVVLAAADTFRAAAVEQLTIWSQRLGVQIVTGETNADPASVAYRAAEAAIEASADLLIVDTAGRLHTQKNLMRELSKIRSVLAKKLPGAPHECLLVLDATTGQNALSQAKSFLEAVQVTGLVLTKLDGTAKGGIVVTINNVLEIPVKFVGVGEKVGDLQAFDAEAFVDALLEVEERSPT